MNKNLFLKLQAEGLISINELEQVLDQPKRPKPLNADLQFLLYAGILMFTTGLGILVYKNIETIGHLAIVLFIAVGMLFCFTYCFINAPGFSPHKISSANILFDYVLLTGSLLMLSLIGYLQLQYQLFGEQWGLATFIPMLILFACAYYFDHLGILSLAIVNLGAWVGISVTPMHLLKENNFSNELIYSGILLAVLLLVLAIYSKRISIKKHFYFTYKNFSTHLLFIALLTGVFNNQSTYWIYFLLLIGAAIFHFITARKERSLYFTVIVTLYFYVALCYIFTRMITSSSIFNSTSIYILLLFYITTGLGLVLSFIHLNNITKDEHRIR